MGENFLYEKLNILKEVDALKEMPEYIRKGISKKIELRAYQIEAFRNSVTYFENEKIRGNKPAHLLYYMATGSGKTIMMAGMMIYLFKKGYRNFLFFVNQNNILEKTKENFLNNSSSKYLFANTIEIDGQRIKVREVKNFSSSDKDSINIRFISMQKLHADLLEEKENSISKNDFEDNKVVLISDEAHHVNTLTKKNGKDAESNASWENTSNMVLNSNMDNILLEFTATADIKDENVLKKYLDKIIFNYPLSKFRESGYTKDFKNLQFDFEIWERIVVALIISEYRKYKFSDLKQNIKPVILMKSSKIKESEAHYKMFFENLKNLSVADINKIRNTNSSILNIALNYFYDKDNTYRLLIQSLKVSFSKEKSLIINSKNDEEDKSRQIYLNSLEDESNPYRIIFTVDMLNEGWDVLNLFDIVRLYETGQGINKKESKKGMTSPVTIKEAQLIGRGARYCPFVDKYEEERYMRKYDDDIENPNAILETLLYHSKENSRYITEIREALKTIGLLPDEMIELEYKLKDTFKNDIFFNEGYLLTNERIKKDYKDFKHIDEKIQNMKITYKVPSGNEREYKIFLSKKEEEIKKEEKKEIKEIKEEIKEIKEEIKKIKEKNQEKDLKKLNNMKILRYDFKDIPINISFAAIMNFENLKFNILNYYFPHLKSTREFLISENYLGNIEVSIETKSEKILNKDLFNAVSKVFNKISEYITRIDVKYIGKADFIPKRVCEIIKDKKIRLPKVLKKGLGKSHKNNKNNKDNKNNKENEANDILDVSNLNWYVFSNNYGIDKKIEKDFIKYFSTSLYPKFKEKYQKIFLIRNERFKELAIYSFDAGERLKPDYILILQKDREKGYEQEQLFIKLKENYLLKADDWEEEFLKQLVKVSKINEINKADNSYKIIGAPFFKSESENRKFKDFFNNFINK